MLINTTMLKFQVNGTDYLFFFKYNLT